MRRRGVRWSRLHHVMEGEGEGGGGGGGGKGGAGAGGKVGGREEGGGEEQEWQLLRFGIRIIIHAYI